MGSQTIIHRCAELCRERGWRLAYGLMGRREDAEDVIQQAMLVVAQKPDSVPRLNPWPWLAQVIAFEARNARRKRSVRAAMPLEDTQVPPPDSVEDEPLASILQSELRNRLWSAYKELPQSQREVLGLVYLSGMSQRSAARALGMPASSLRLILKEGLARLRGELGLDSEKTTGRALSALPLPLVAAQFAGSVLIPSASTTIAAGGSAAAWTGAIAMNKVKIGVAAALLVLAVAGGVWLAGRDSELEQSPTDTSEARVEDRRVTGGSNRPKGRESASSQTESNRPERDEVASTQPVSPDNPKPAAPDTTEEATTLEPASLTSVEEPEQVRSMLVSGVVVDKDGIAVSGAKVSAAILGASVGDNELPAKLGSRSGASGPHGAFQIDMGNVPSGATVEVSATHGSLAPSLVRVIPAKSGEAGGLILELGWNGQIRGTVVRDRDDAVMIGSRVVLESQDRKDSRFAGETRTGAGGEFQFWGLRPGLYFITVNGPELTSLVDHSVEGSARPGIRTGKMVRVPDGGGIAEAGEMRLPSFNVLSFRLAAPAGGTVFVSISRSDYLSRLGYGHWGVPLKPSEDGVYRADWLNSSHRSLEIKANGFALTRFPIEPKEGEDLDLGVLELDFGRKITGHVKDDSGRGIIDAQLEIEVDVDLPFQAPPGSRIKQPKGNAVSGAGGAFVMDAVSAGNYVLICQHPEYGLVRLKVSVSRDTDPRPITITMPRAATVFGTLPVPPAGQEELSGEPRDVVALVPTNNFRVSNSLQVRPGFMRFLADGAEVFGSIAEDGSFEIPGVAPGEYHVIGVRNGHATLRAFVQVQSWGRVRVDFDWTPDETAISGRVMEAGGGPLEGVKVTISRNPNARSTMGQLMLDTTTNANGEYSFEGLFPGTFVVITGRDPAPYSNELIEARTIQAKPREQYQKNIELPREDCVVTGRATMNGKPMINAVWASQAGVTGAPRIGGEIDENGDYRVVLQGAGRWVLIFEYRESNGGSPPSFGGPPPSRRHVFASTVDADENGAKHSINFVTSAVSGSVLLPSGEPAGNARVIIELADAQGVQLSSTTANPQGRYFLPYVQTGAALIITATLDGYLPGSVNLAADAERTGADISLSGQGGTLEIAITQITGVPATETTWTYATATLYLIGSDGQPSPVPSSSRRLPWRPGYDGSSKLNSLPTGMYRVVIAGAVEQWTTTVSITAGDTTRIEPALVKASE